jgi:hypothetical protein
MLHFLSISTPPYPPLGEFHGSPQFHGGADGRLHPHRHRDRHHHHARTGLQGALTRR